MAKILIPTPLRQFVGGADTVEVSASNVGELLEKLTAQHPDIRKNILNEEGKLRSFVNIYVNDEDVRFLGGLEAELGEGDSVTVLPAVAGG